MYSPVHGFQIHLKVNSHHAKDSHAYEVKVQCEMGPKHYGTEKVPRCETALA